MKEKLLTRKKTRKRRIVAFAHRHRSILGVACHIILTPVNQFAKINFKMQEKLLTRKITRKRIVAFAHRHRSILGVACHIIRTPANQFAKINFKMN
jgi:hypothetical protein